MSLVGLLTIVNATLDVRGRGKAMVVNYQSRARAPIGTTARTSERCPESGVWQAQASPTTTAPIAKGNIMPPYRGAAVVWKLIRYA